MQHIEKTVVQHHRTSQEETKIFGTGIQDGVGADLRQRDKQSQNTFARTISEVTPIAILSLAFTANISLR